MTCLTITAVAVVFVATARRLYRLSRQRRDGPNLAILPGQNVPPAIVGRERNRRGSSRTRPSTVPFKGSARKESVTAQHARLPPALVIYSFARHGSTLPHLG